MKPRTPSILVAYLPSGAATVTASYGGRSVTAAGRWAVDGPVWMPGAYDRSHRVGLHGGRLAVVQQGVRPLRVCDAAHHGGQLARATVATRGGWRGWNIHDDRGGLEGCIGIGAADLLDLLGLLEQARAAGAEQHPEGGVYATVRVEHRP